jgi:hypothetical protein
MSSDDAPYLPKYVNKTMSSAGILWNYEFLSFLFYLSMYISFILVLEYMYIGFVVMY